MIGYTSQIQTLFWSMLEVYNAALDVWKTQEAAKDFLTRPHPMLDGKTPLTRCMQSKKGHTEVLSIIGRLKHGSAA
jgi:putative toxin-antitoxin system antitoxin component (TIGR02293 family)